MKKNFSTFFILFSLFYFAQTRDELTKVMLSSKQVEIFDFIQKYPNNPNVPFLKKRIEMLKGNGASVAKPSVKPLNKEKLEIQVEKTKEKTKEKAEEKAEGKAEEKAKAEENNELAGKTKSAENALNHFFSNDRNKNEAYVLIKNKSNCNLVVKFEGKKTYFNLDVPKLGENYILVPKGSYKITTMICDAQYSSVKNLTEDMQIVLNAQKAKK